MKNQNNWRPSKYIYKNGRLIASRDKNEINVASRLMADLIAERYDNFLQYHAKGKLLDLGCGKAPLYQAYKDYVVDTTCVDWENTLHKNEHLDFECDLTKKLPFDAREFQTVILSDVLEHIAEPEKLLKEVSRVLSEGGKLILNVPFYYWVHEQPHDYYRYTEHSLKRFVEKSDLSLVQLDPIGGSPEILADIFAKHFKFIPIIGQPLAIAIQYIVKVFIKTSIGRKLSKKTAEVFPFGYFLIAEKTK